MKITKQRLKEIIKEEVASHIREAGWDAIVGEGGARPINPVKMGSKKGYKISGNWKDEEIKVQWLEKNPETGKMKLGPTVSVKTHKLKRIKED